MRSLLIALLGTLLLIGAVAAVVLFSGGQRSMRKWAECVERGEKLKRDQCKPQDAPPFPNQSDRDAWPKRCAAEIDELTLAKCGTKPGEPLKGRAP